MKILALLLFVCACSSPPQAQLVGALAFSVGSIEVTDTPGDSAFRTTSSVGIELAAGPQPVAVSCADGGPASDGAMLYITVFSFGDGGPGPPSGTYSITFLDGDICCEASVELSVPLPDGGLQGHGAESGSVTLTQTLNGYVGSFSAEMSLQDGGTSLLQGSFAAPLCGG